MERPGRDAFATRFDAYVVELREVFASGGLRFGRPKDVTVVAQALSAHGRLREDAAAVIRSVLYREHESLSRAELASIVVVAAGGKDLYGSAQEGDGVRQLDDFVSGVRLAMRASAREEHETEVEADVVQAEAGPVIQAPLRREEVRAEPDVDQVPVAAVERTRVMAGVYSQARMMSEGGGRAGTREDGTYFLKAKAEETVASPDSEGTSRAVHEREGRAGGYWRWAAVCFVLVAVLGTGLLWRYRTARVGDRSPEAKDSLAAGASSQTSPPSSGAVQRGSQPSGSTATGTGVTVLGARSGGSPASASDSADGPRRPGQVFPVAPGASLGTAIGSSLPSSAAPIPMNEVPDASAKVEPAPKPKPAASSVRVTGGAAAIGGKYVVSSGVMSGHLISAPQPAYPKMAKIWGIEGQVILQAVISAKGRVVATNVLDGHKMLRGSATKAVKKWRYRPYLEDGKPADIATVVIVDYKLKP